MFFLCFACFHTEYIVAFSGASEGDIKVTVVQFVSIKTSAVLIQNMLLATDYMIM